MKTGGEEVWLGLTWLDSLTSIREKEKEHTKEKGILV